MQIDYTITFNSEIKYPSPVNGGHWQLLLLPEVNESQEIQSVEFANSLLVGETFSINGFGYKTIRFSTSKPFERLKYKLRVRLLKKVPSHQNKIFSNVTIHKSDLQKINFKAEHHTFLRETALTKLPAQHFGLWKFQNNLSVSENLTALSTTIHQLLNHKETNEASYKSISKVLEQKTANSESFVHFFCSVLRHNYFPARLVTGYRYTDTEVDSSNENQIHIWAEVYVPGLGYISFDPVFNKTVDEKYLKIACGADFSQCEPYKEVLYFKGNKTSSKSIQIKAQQQ